jgi:hypothetical protein
LTIPRNRRRRRSKTRFRHCYQRSTDAADAAIEERVMSTVGGPGGIGGPGGVGGAGGPEGPDGPDGPDGPEGVDGASATDAVDTVAASDIDALAAEVAAGRLTRQEAIDRLVEATAGPDLGPTERAELRELLGDLVANDPYLNDLMNRV